MPSFLEYDPKSASIQSTTNGENSPTLHVFVFQLCYLDVTIWMKLPIATKMTMDTIHFMDKKHWDLVLKYLFLQKKYIYTGLDVNNGM